MGLETAKDGKLLYHLTELKNLESIVKIGLRSRRKLISEQLPFSDIADPNIIDERKERGLDEYIPFHFHPYSAFDVAVKYKHDQEKMAYICVSREFAMKEQFKVLPKHPLAGNECVLYDFSEGINKIDWDKLMQVGNSTEDAKAIKMAEALCNRTIYVKEFQSIAVETDEDKEWVKDILNKYCVGFRLPFVDARPMWF